MAERDNIRDDPSDYLDTPGSSVLLLEVGTDHGLERVSQLVETQAIANVLIADYHTDADQATRTVSSLETGETCQLLLADYDAIDSCDSVTVRRVPSPDDLTQIGIECSSYLRESEPRGGQTAICIHSLSALLESSDIERVFKFLHILTARIAATDAIGLFFVDSAAHDEKTVYTLRSLFDDTVATDALSGLTN